MQFVLKYKLKSNYAAKNPMRINRDVLRTVSNIKMKRFLENSYLLASIVNYFDKSFILEVFSTPFSLRLQPRLSTKINDSNTNNEAYAKLFKFFTFPIFH